MFAVFLTEPLVFVTQLQPELPLQSLSQSEPESGPPQPPQPPAPPTQDPHQLQPQSQDQPALQQEQASNLEHQETPLWMKHQRALLLVLGLTVCAAILGLLYYIHHSLHRNNTITGRPARNSNVGAIKSQFYKLLELLSYSFL